MNSALTIGLHRPAPSPEDAGPRRVEVSICPNENTESDESLIARLQVNGSGAMSLLFRRYAQPVRSVGQRILRDNGEADDLVQEVFFYVHRKSVLFDKSKGSARSWIIQVAYTQALLRRRLLKSHGFYASAIADKSSEDSNCGGKGAYYDSSVEDSFGRTGWKKVWDSLNECQRQTLHLHFYEGYTFTEIAKRLGQSYVNIRHHYYRGLEKLRKHADENNINWP
jgi:RNA polymerase sigma-70 factor (ECF subfamily)